MINENSIMNEIKKSFKLRKEVLDYKKKFDNETTELNNLDFSYISKLQKFSSKLN